MSEFRVITPPAHGCHYPSPFDDNPEWPLAHWHLTSGETP
jgi:hypothetical protein